MRRLAAKTSETNSLLKCEEKLEDREGKEIEKRKGKLIKSSLKEKKMKVKKERSKCEGKEKNEKKKKKI